MPLTRPVGRTAARLRREVAEKALIHWACALLRPRSAWRRESGVEPPPSAPTDLPGSGGFDAELAAEIGRIPEPGSFERLSHVVGLSKLCCRRFLALGGIDRMVSAGLLDGTPADAVRTAAALPTFCGFHEARDAVRRAGGCQPLAVMLSVDDSDERRIAAAAAVRDLCVGNAANKELFSASAMPALVRALGSESQHLQEAAAAAYSELVEGCNAGKQAARRAGAPGQLLRLCASANGRVRLQAVRALARSLADDPPNQDLMRADVVSVSSIAPPTTGLGTLAAGLRDTEPALRRAFAQALLACVYDNRANMAALQQPQLLATAGLETGELHRALLRALAATLAAEPLLRPFAWPSPRHAGPARVTCGPDGGLPHYGVLLAGSWSPDVIGIGSDSPRLHAAPQFALHAPSPMALSIHLAPNRLLSATAFSTSTHGLRLLCFTAAGPNNGRADVVFHEIVLPPNEPASAAEGPTTDCASLSLDLPAGDFTVLALCGGAYDGPLGFRLAFAGEREFEVEAVPALAGWHRGSSGPASSGAFAGWWTGGSDPDGAAFWRNPQFLLTRHVAAPVDKSSNDSTASQLEDSMSAARSLLMGGPKESEALLVEIRIRPRDGQSPPELGLLAFHHPSATAGGDGPWRRFPGRVEPMVAENDSGELNRRRSMYRPVGSTVLVSVPGRLLVALDSNDDQPIGVVPYLMNDAAGDVDFDINLFSTTPAR